MLERIESLVAEMIERVESLKKQIESSMAEQVQRETQNHELAVQLVDFDAERNACETRDSLLQFESEQVRARLTEIDDTLHDARHLLDQSRDRRAELCAAAAKLQSDVQYMSESCLNELGVQRDELMAETTIPIARGEQLLVEDQIHREMRSRLDAMGPVNMMALEEYKETAERHAFLDTQRKDLYDSIENTRATIKEIDIFSRQKFEEAFHKINENFQVTFRKLFGGGTGIMRLTDEENSAESGIFRSWVASIRAMRRMASSEWPPSSKKFSWMPTRSRPRISAQRPANSTSAGVWGDDGHGGPDNSVGASSFGGAGDIGGVWI